MAQDSGSERVVMTQSLPGTRWSGSRLALLRQATEADSSRRNFLPVPPFECASLRNRAASVRVRHRLRSVLPSLLLAVFLLGGCSHAARQPVAETATPDYVIGAGDVLNIFVYRAPELSVEGLPVRPDGRISVPLVQDIDAAGLTPTQLGVRITERLKQYVRDPSVTVMVRGFVGPIDWQIRVIGEAAEPLAIPYRENMTVLDVMIAAHGLTRFAAGNRASIVRRAQGTQRTINVRLSDLLKDGDIGQNVAMQPGDILVIPQTWL
jgi:polysaccharide biosynthesis/export protein